MPSVHLPGVPDETVIGIFPAGELADLGLAEAVMIIEPRWFDDRQTCGIAQAYLHGEIEATPAEWRACGMYRPGRCRAAGEGKRCIFEEPESAAIWQKAASWRYVTFADGSRALARASEAAKIQAEILAESEVTACMNS